MLKFLFYGLTPPEDAHLNLFLAYAEDGSYLLIGFSLKVAKLYAAALFFGKAVDNLSYYSYVVVPRGLFERSRSVVRFFCTGSVIQRSVAVLRLGYAVESDITAYSQTESLYRLYFVPRITSVPNLDERVLNDVFCLFAIKRDTQSQPEEHILQGQNIIPKTDFIHRF